MRYRTPAIVLGLLLLAAAVYAPVTRYGFISLDDQFYVTNNPPVVAGLGVAGVKWAFTSMYAGYWIPLTWLSLMADAELFGGWAGGFHLTNLLLHTAAAAILFLALRGLTGALWKSAAVAALFAVHPIHVESVAWVTERKDVLAGLFFALALLAYGHYSRRPGLAKYLTLATFFACGLMAKPMLVPLPLLLLLLDWWPLGRFSAVATRRLVVEKLPLLVLSAGFSAITIAAHRGAGGIIGMENIPFGARLANSLVVTLRYLAKTVLPWDFAVYIPHPGRGIPAWQAVGAAVVLAGLTFLAFRARKKPFLAVGWLWFLGMLAPVNGLLQAGGQGMAYRFVYLPLIGIYLASVWALDFFAAARRPGRALLPVLVGAVIAALSFGARAQLRYWEDSVELALHTLALTGDNAFVRHNLGLELHAKGRYAEAITHLAEEVRLLPRSPDARTSLARALLEEGLIAEAGAQIEQALMLDPKHAEALYLGGYLLTKQGQIADSIPWFHRALSARPDHVDARFNLALSLSLEGRREEAAREYREVLRLQPSDVEARLGLGRVLLDLQRGEEAAAEYRVVLQMKPDSEEARSALSEIAGRR
jgi:tetratricopeptide (TPR) repeat protein